MSETPRVTQAHTSDETEGGLFGVPIRSLLWLMPLLIVAGLLCLSMSRRMSFVQAGLRTLVPVFLLFILLRYITSGTPVGILLDQWVSLLMPAQASPMKRTSSVAGKLLTSLPDGYVEDGLIVFGGLQGQVSAGFWIDLPDLSNAPIPEANRTQEIWSSIWRLLPEDWSCQLLAIEDNNRMTHELLDYAEATKSFTTPAAKRLRDTNFVQLWGQMESGHLRRRRLVLFVGHPISAGVSESSTQLSVVQKSIHDWSITIRHLLESGGGNMSPLESKDIIRLWAETLNPSIRSERSYDPAAHYAHQNSLLDNFWTSELMGTPHGGFLLDGVMHLALSVSRLPKATFPGIMNSLTRLDFPWLTLCLQTRRLSKETVLKDAQAKLERVHRQQLEKPNPRLAVSQHQLESKIQRLTAHGVVPMEAELVVIVRAKCVSEINERAAAVKQAIHQMVGAVSFEATISRSSQNLFSKCFPGWMWSPHQGYRHYLEDPTTADLVPLLSSFSGHPGPIQSLFPGVDGGLVNVVTSLGRDNDSSPQHMVVLGSTGGGKSAVVTKLLLETADDVVFTAIVESGLSQVEYTRALQAEPLRFDLNGAQTINFLSTHGRPRCPFYLKTTGAIIGRMLGITNMTENYKLQEALISKVLEQTTSDHANDCLRRLDSKRKDDLLRHGAAIRRRMLTKRSSFIKAYEDFRTEMMEFPEAIARELSQFDTLDLQRYEADPESHLHDLLFSILTESEQLTLSSLQEAFELSENAECRSLALTLVGYCRKSANGLMFDGATNVKLSESVVHYELGSIPESAQDLKSIIGFAAINQLRAKCQSIPRRYRKRVVIDELARFLAFPGGEEMVKEMFEGFRKYNTQIIVIGQQFSQIADTPIHSAITGNAKAWLIFNTGNRTDVERLATELRLPALAKDSIRTLSNPDTIKGKSYSEFLYVHKLSNESIFGRVRYFLIPT